jgi:hypothetical protein
LRVVFGDAYPLLEAYPNGLWERPDQYSLLGYARLWCLRREHVTDEEKVAE